MRRRVVARGNIHHSDYLRALVTDTLPGDVPIIVSNDGFYRNYKSISDGNRDVAQYVDALFSPKPYTKPYRYNILRIGGGVRRLSLIHPSSQIDVARFYQKYAHLICYYCRKSETSIRAPEKVGSLFFVRGPNSERNKLKGARVDTTDIENSVSNPASFFSYRGHDRAYKFFASSDYLRLEKRYRVMYFADVARCFNSIYTHTLFWAVTDVHFAKENKQAQTFSNSFDALMQGMNYNETNGICIGAEVSRIFAEVILSEVDRRAVEYLKQNGLRYKVEYEFRRYVDDYYIFAATDEIGKRVIAACSRSLLDFNLNFNEAKTDKLDRPFLTKKSRLIRATNISLTDFFERFIESKPVADGAISCPKRIWRASALLRSFLESIKAVCFDHEAAYEAVANYVISALLLRISALVDGYEAAIEHAFVSREEYLTAVLLLLETIYFFYTMHPTTSSSLKVAQAAILASDFIEENIPDRSPFLTEQLVRWTVQFVRGVNSAVGQAEADCVPLEALNILLVLGEVGCHDLQAQRAIVDLFGQIRNLRYFEIVCFLYCVRDRPEFEELRRELFDRARAIIFEGGGVRMNAEAAHLALDMLACPYLSRRDRVTLFRELRKELSLPNLSRLNAIAAIEAIEAAPWFVNWKQMSLLRMIRKKELSSVY